MSLQTRAEDMELIKKIKEAMTAIGIPDRTIEHEFYMPERMDFSELVGLTQEEVLDVDILPLLNDCPRGEEGHSARVAIIGTLISKILGFKRDERIEYFLTTTSHDLGKLKVRTSYPEKNPYPAMSQDYLEFLEEFKQGHVSPGNIPYHWGMRVASAIEGSHYYQRGVSNNGPYPEKLALPRNPESTLLSKLVAIPDFIDAITSRPSKNIGKYLSCDEILSLTIKEYGDLVINYTGDLYTKVDTCGREIIRELQKKGYVGRARPSNVTEKEFRMNPFKGLIIE